MARVKKPSGPETCQWREDDDANWWTDCDGAFVLNDGTPSENRMKFCCYCGRPLKQKPMNHND